MQKWEYKTLSTPSDLVLDHLGGEGWELCGMQGCFYVFKRPVAAVPELKQDAKKAPIRHRETA